jgi:DNA-binding MarR family transcriptional regulator
MVSRDEATQLREYVRILERKLGVLEDGEMSCCGLTLAQCHALVEIGRTGQISLVELAKLLALDTSTMSRTVNNLVVQNMAQRELDSNDRRYVTIRLTPDGERNFRGIEASMGEYFSKICEAIPPEKRRNVLESLEILLQAIEDSDCC